MSIGILFAIVAMICWGFGDFLIQRSIRKIGDWETLFLITFFGVILLLPFAWNDIGIMLTNMGTGFIILVVGGVILFVAALLEFEALKRGKISVVEPAWSLEIPAAGILAFLILGETLTGYQVLLIIFLIFGLFLISFRGQAFSKSFFLEKGVTISIIAAIIMGCANFFVGWGARETTPLAVNFAVCLIAALGSGIFLGIRGKLLGSFKHLVISPKVMLPMIFLDNIAWIAFAYGMVLAPIGITVALSESYIIIAVILGFLLNKERLERHQYLGLALAVVAAVALAAFS